MQPHRIEHVEFFGGPLDGHVLTASLPTDQLNDVAAIPVNQDIIEMLSGRRSQAKGPATSIAVYVRQDEVMANQQRSGTGYYREGKEILACLHNSVFGPWTNRT